MIKKVVCDEMVVRLTAALRDQVECLSLRPGCELPVSVGLARNSYVHDQKPSLEHLKLVAKSALEFIKSNYWFCILFVKSRSRAIL